MLWPWWLWNHRLATSWSGFNSWSRSCKCSHPSILFQMILSSNTDCIFSPIMQSLYSMACWTLAGMLISSYCRLLDSTCVCISHVNTKRESPKVYMVSINVRVIETWLWYKMRKAHENRGNRYCKTVSWILKSFIWLWILQQHGTRYNQSQLRTGTVCLETAT